MKQRIPDVAASMFKSSRFHTFEKLRGYLGFQLVLIIDISDQFDCFHGYALHLSRRSLLFYELKPSKIVFGPADLKNDDAAKRTYRNRVGFLVAGNCGGATIGMLESAMASGCAYMNESLRFKCADDVAGGNPFRDVQTVTITAGNSVDAMRAAGGISLPSPESSSTIM